MVVKYITNYLYILSIYISIKHNSILVHNNRMLINSYLSPLNYTRFLSAVHEAHVREAHVVPKLLVSIKFILIQYMKVTSNIPSLLIKEISTLKSSSS